jgi:hypothetical protein
MKKIKAVNWLAKKCGAAPGHHHRDNYFPLDGDLTAGPLLLPGFPGIFETS